MAPLPQQQLAAELDNAISEVLLRAVNRLANTLSDSDQEDEADQGDEPQIDLQLPPGVLDSLRSSPATIAAAVAAMTPEGRNGYSTDRVSGGEVLLQLHRPCNSMLCCHSSMGAAQSTNTWLPLLTCSQHAQHFACLLCVCCLQVSRSVQYILDHAV